MTDDAEIAAQAEAEYAKASKKVSTSKASKGAAGIEREFSMAYQKLVQLKLRPQIRGRYR